MNSNIQPIDKASIHRLTSGQVITDLATAVKELVDNALDANATTVDLRLCDYGKSLVEVSDNGTGVAPADRVLLARKYHTSKLSKFDDLETLRTLGFRGEALSSLCAVSHVAVVTKVAEEECGVRLEYDEHGELSVETMTALEDAMWGGRVPKGECQSSVQSGGRARTHARKALIEAGGRARSTRRPPLSELADAT